MKWLVGDEWDGGLLELDDGSIIAKEYQLGFFVGTKVTWRLISAPTKSPERMKNGKRNSN
jgi:hypothetical protein